MATIDDLLQKVGDPVLRERLAKEIKDLKNKRKVGLVFEEHLPECTPLYGVEIKKGTCVALRDREINEIFGVLSVENGTAHCISCNDKTFHDFDVNDITAVAEFGEPIYPYLKELDRVCNAPGNDAWHTLIEADNFHALQLLKYMYAGKVDCIYIDPPYNTGAKDWKYNNRFVDNNDGYTHSKWLSFMKRRLELAHELLNPDDSVLIVTIDEKEYLRLGMLLEDIFKDARIQMISSVINPKGQSRNGTFARTDEYLYILWIGKAVAQSLPLSKEWKTSENTTTNDIYWQQLRRRGRTGHVHRTDSPGCFYPIFVYPDTLKIHSIGEPVPLGESKESVNIPKGTVAIFPMMANGEEGCFQTTPDGLRKLYEKGYFRITSATTGGLLYLKKGEIAKVENGTYRVIGRRENDGSVITEVSGDLCFLPGTQWNLSSHNAGVYGTSTNNSLMPDRSFTYPKSVYAVEDVLRFFVANKPNALILDFFAGSGTTAHATMLLNHLDGGHRRCISVTNNEISAEEEKKFTKQGLRHGDPQWEARGIARYVTWPRIKAAVTGINTLGEPIKGSYKFNEEFPMSDGFAENAIYFKLGFLDKNAVALCRQFRELLPVLWMKAGCMGPCPHIAEGDGIPEMMILLQNKMAILIDETEYASFAEKMENHPEIETVFIITDSERGYREMAKEIGVENTFQLYGDYLENFKINYGSK